MSWLNNIWIELGFKPHPSNKTHFIAGILVGLLFFPLCYFEFFSDLVGVRWGYSALITFGAGIFFGSLKEWLDKVNSDNWDWLDLIYTVAGAISVVLLFTFGIVIYNQIN